jgi:hypothetical protein
MALKGNLRDFSTTQLLNLISLARKTGTLVVEGPGQVAQLSFRSGKLNYANLSRQDSRLAHILHRAGKLSNEQARAVGERARNAGDKELGLLLINAGYVSQADILLAIRTHVLDAAYGLMAWSEGEFHFEPDVVPGPDKITVPIDLENVIIEGARRMREVERLTEELPSLDLALKFADHPNVDIRGVKLNVDEWKVVSFVNPKNTMKAIARTNNLSELEMRRIVYGLLQAGLVEVVRPPAAQRPRHPMAPAAAPAQPSPQQKQEQRGLIGRLISRIRAL